MTFPFAPGLPNLLTEEEVNDLIKLESVARTAGSGGLINKNTAELLVGNYKSLHHSYLQSHPMIGYDTTYAQFDIDKLINFLTYLKTGGATDCRIYLGAHDATAFSPTGYNYSNKTTLVLVGIKKGADGCAVENISEADPSKLGLDFGSLCPPECPSCACYEDSIATRVFTNLPCKK